MKANNITDRVLLKQIFIRFLKENNVYRLYIIDNKKVSIENIIKNKIDNNEDLFSNVCLNEKQNVFWKIIRNRWINLCIDNYTFNGKKTNFIYNNGMIDLNLFYLVIITIQIISFIILTFVI